jgi:hypothetical protein
LNKIYYNQERTRGPTDYLNPQEENKMDKNWENVKMLADKLEWLDERHPAYESIFVEFGENTDEKKELIEDRESVDKLIELFGKEVTAAARKLVKIRKEIRRAAEVDDIPALLRAIADRTDLKSR